MLEVTIPEKELFDEDNNEFVKIPETTLCLEHSLLSVKKWESIHHKPFLGKEKTIEEIIDYVRCMTIPTKKINPEVYKYIPVNVLEQILEYIKDPMTATWFNDANIGGSRSSSEAVTAEIIYYWMITLNIPVEFQKWHLEQLLTLIKVCNVKNAPKKKMSKKEAAMQRRQLNAARRAKYNTKG